MRSLVFLLVVAAGLLPAGAQTTGVAGVNNYTINGQGSGATSCGAVNLSNEVGIVITNQVTGPADGIVVVVDGTCNPGAFVIEPGPPTYSVDVFPFAITLDPFATLGNVPLLPFMTIPPSGSWSLALTYTGPSAAFTTQVGILHPSFPFGIGTTQALTTTITTFAPLCGGGSLLAPLTDDGSVNVALSAPFTFYGTSYTDVFVNMNGNLTFCSGDTDFSPTTLEMADDEARIAPAWDDWSPQDANQGTIFVNDTGASLTVEWLNVRHFGASCTGIGDSNNFCTTLDLAGGIVTFQYGTMNLCAGGTPSGDTLVGISAGFSEVAPCAIPPIALPTFQNVDLATAGTVNTNGPFTPFDGIGENFDPTEVGGGVFGAFDLSGLTITFTPDAAGTTYTQN